MIPAAGVLARLDGASDLGVDATWLSPIHPSPGPDAVRIARLPVATERG